MAAYGGYGRSTFAARLAMRSINYLDTSVSLVSRLLRSGFGSKKSYSDTGRRQEVFCRTR